MRDASGTSDLRQPLLLDVSRLIWRVWSGRLPTGIDRVCLAYVAHFGPRARAVVQRGRWRAVLAARDSQRLFAVLTSGGPHVRRRLIAVLAAALPGALAHRPRRGALYLDIGHTGLDSPRLPAWIARHDLRAVYLVHDLIPIELPQYCRPGEAERHGARMTNVLRSASGVITNSQATLDALRHFAVAHALPDPPGVVAWLAGDALPVGIAAPPARAYFVVVGTIEGRKNQLLLLRIWRRLAERMGATAPRLVIVGQRGWEADATMAMLDELHDPDGAVCELGRCDDAELARLLGGARALLLPSFAEGFGMPVVEAMRLGTPVILSDLPVFREIAGDIPTYLSPSDVAGWEVAILDFCGPSAARTRQIAALRSYRAPDWSTHFAIVERFLAALPG